MNRIILIGNGFDLAHNLKTSYKHFINDFWDKQNSKMFSKIFNKEGLDNIPYEDNFVKVDAPYRVLDYIRKSTEQKHKGYNLFLTFSPIPITIIDANNNDNTDFICKNDFLKKISEKSIENWVDIEYEYYQSLIDCLNNKEDVNKLNEEFKQIKNALEIYLTEQSKCNIAISNNIKKIFFSDTDANKDIVCFLNFNYTKTLDQYTYATKNTRTINIHGELNSSNNPVIFGYGDELDENYKNIESINNNVFHQNIKSARYSLTNNYGKVLSFLYHSNYEVFIIGHSCGLSDRTLLNNIFEHENCKSVKIFYHQIDPLNDNFLETYINLSRNFNDKQLLRKIVVSKENSIPLEL